MSSKKINEQSAGDQLQSTLSRWTVDSAYSKDDIIVRKLFEVVFAHPMSQVHWNWKYAQTELKGIILKNTAGESVAFFGGMPRVFYYKDESFYCVQNGDVMVLPSERGVFSKKGALYQVASSFFNMHVGLQRKYAFAFGFPNLRHFTLGVKLGLYEQAGQMKELRWPIPKKKKKFFWRWTVENSVQSLSIADLWQRMQKDFSHNFVAVRDESRWSYRYDQHPSLRYSLLCIRSNLSRKVMAAVVLREHEAYCELIDFVGGEKYIQLAVQASREFAAEREKSTFLLISDAVHRYFSTEECQITESSIKVPVNISIHDVKNKPWIENIWLMAGDSDFM